LITLRLPASFGMERSEEEWSFRLLVRHPTTAGRRPHSHASGARPCGMVYPKNCGTTCRHRGPCGSPARACEGVPTSTRWAVQGGLV